MEYKTDRLSDLSDESLIAELQRVAKRLGKNTVTREDLNQYGKVSPDTIHRRFGWSKALKKADSLLLATDPDR